MPARLDTTFAALADSTRRGVLEHLGRKDASISELALKFQMSPTGMKKHIAVLEQAGLVGTCKIGRVRTCRLGQSGLEHEAAWLDQHRRLWASRFEALDQALEEWKTKEESHEPEK